MGKAKKIAAFLGKLIFIIAAFVLLFRPETYGFDKEMFQDITPYSLVEVLKEVDPLQAVLWVAFGVLVKLAGIFCGIVRWRLLLRTQGIHMPLWYQAKCWFMGRAIGLWLPGTAGLDGYRIVESSRYSGEVLKCTTVVVIEKITGFIALFFLVFLTLPLGLDLLPFNKVMLAVVLAVLLSFIIVSVAMLFNPRVLHILIRVVPVPGFLRSKVHKLGAALHAFEEHRLMLFTALVLGVGVHLGTSLMYFGTASALRSPNVSLWDILFASPLVIVASVFALTISGLGAREIVYGYFIGQRAGVANAVMAGHMGLWTGEIIPYALSVPLLLFTTRPKREQLMSDLEAVRKAAERDKAVMDEITPEQAKVYRQKLVHALLAGALAGLLAGALVGLGEAAWVVLTIQNLEETGAFWWGPLVTGLGFIPVGAGITAAAAFICLMLDRFPRPSTVFAVAFGGCLTTGAFVLGWWRFMRDVLDKHIPAMPQTTVILLCALALGGIATLVTGLLLGKMRGGVWKAVGAGFGAHILVVLVGLAAAAVTQPPERATPPLPDPASSGPNIILIVADALRADYLPQYSADAVADAPNLSKMREEGVFFENAFSQAAWTKPAFATIFSGVYPSTHTATSQTAALPEEVITFPEVLLEHGYYTKGFSNNPNITRTFNFQQGFADYVDLKPNIHFGASGSASLLTAYNVLRLLRERIPGKGMEVTDAYQPAEVVNQVALDWFNSDERPEDRPFLLFLHYMETHDPFMDWENPGVGYARVRLKEPDPEKYLEPMKHAYNLEIEYLDTHLGELFAALQEAGLYEDSVIIFTSDHGEEFYDHEGWWHGRTLYDEITHIPLLIKLPGGQGAGTNRTDFARHIDIGPTLLNLAGYEQPKQMPGAPLVEFDGAYAGANPDYVYGENDFEGNVLEAVRTFTHKLITANPGNPRGLEPLEFYDLEQDPGEQDNLAGTGGVELNRLRKLLDDMHAYVHENAAKPELMKGSMQEIEQQLKAVGYGE